MPPVGGDLFIGGGYDDDVDVGVCAHDDSDERDPVSQVACDLLPTEYESEGDDSIYIVEHDQHTSVLESKLRWRDNSQVTKPKPLHKLAGGRGYKNVELVCERVPHIPIRKHQIVLLQKTFSF